MLFGLFYDSEIWKSKKKHGALHRVKIVEIFQVAICAPPKLENQEKHWSVCSDGESPKSAETGEKQAGSSIYQYSLS